MVCPFSQLLIRSLVVDCVAEDANLSATKEQMCQIVDIFISCGIPYIQGQLMLLPCFVLDIDDLSVVLHHIRVILLLAFH